MKIAVVGGGIFGCTAAIYAARAGHDVWLYDKNINIMWGASMCNQYRLHRGFHYPRSGETIEQALACLESFRREYHSAIHFNNHHYYAVANTGSSVDATHCQEVWSKYGLWFEEVDNPRGLLYEPRIEAVYRVHEESIDYHRLTNIIWGNMIEAGVTIKMRAEIRSPAQLKDYDVIINATYGQTNWGNPKEFQYELCEKPMVSLPARFDGISMVVIDGPFMCVDAYGEHHKHAVKQSLLGNVSAALHDVQIGTKIQYVPGYDDLIDNGMSPAKSEKVQKVTRFGDFIAMGQEYIPGLCSAKHLGSMFTWRAVPPYREHDDARPTVIDTYNNRYINIFSGKLGTAVWAAEQTMELLS